MKRTSPRTTTVSVFVPMIRRGPRVVITRIQQTMTSRAPVTDVSDLYALSSGLWAARYVAPALQLLRGQSRSRRPGRSSWEGRAAVRIPGRGRGASLAMG